MRRGGVSGEFVFVNYCNPSTPSNVIGTIPVVTMHGTCLNLSEGFVFSSLEYARASIKMLDWHRDLAARVVAGGVIVIGNQLDEPDFDNHLAIRESAYGGGNVAKNFIVIPNPDEIKAANYEAAGFSVINCTAEQFFEEVFSVVKPKSIAEIVIESTPIIKRAVNNVKAMTWFRGAFRVSLEEIEHAAGETGILRHFVSGADPEWFYIVNSAHASTSVISDLVLEITNLLKSNTNGVGVLHVTGPSGSGKTTAIRGAIYELVRAYPYVYEFDGEHDIDVEMLRNIIEGFTEKSVFVFYSAAEYYYAINIISDRLRNHHKPYTLFILEDRTNEYKRNYRQIANPKGSKYFEIPSLEIDDAILISKKIQDSGLVIEKFSDLPMARRAKTLVDKERGYAGDLLSALFSLTAHENFERKVFEEYYRTPEGLPRKIFDIIVILGAHGFPVPIDYIGGFLGERPEVIAKCLDSELAGILIMDSKNASVRCRHKIIATYYFDNCIAGDGDVDVLVGMLEFLSRMFTVDDIKYHPLPYKMYREIISFEFMHDAYYPITTRLDDTERTYHEVQRFFGRDGIFWLHFGRFYRKTKRWDEAIDCFRAGLKFYDSFQTAHSLGTALLEKYISNGCQESSLYHEGVEILEAQRQLRGARDPYPTTTLLGLLIRIKGVQTDNSDVIEKIRSCLNAGVRQFKDDEVFQDLLSKYYAISGLSS